MTAAALLLSALARAQTPADVPGLGKAVENIGAGGNGSITTLLGSLLVVVGAVAFGFAMLYLRAHKAMLAEKDARLADSATRLADEKAANAKYTEFAIKCSDALVRAADEMRARRGA